MKENVDAAIGPTRITPAPNANQSMIYYSLLQVVCYTNRAFETM